MKLKLKQLLVDVGLVKSISHAKRLIKQGAVRISYQKHEKA